MYEKEKEEVQEGLEKAGAVSKRKVRRMEEMIMMVRGGEGTCKRNKVN